MACQRTPSDAGSATAEAAGAASGTQTTTCSPPRGPRPASNVPPISAARSRMLVIPIPPGPSLALITCGGQYNRTTRSYSDNVVIYARPETPDIPVS